MVDNSITQTAFDMDPPELNNTIKIEFVSMLRDERRLSEEDEEEETNDLYERKERELKEEKKHKEKEEKKKR